MSEASKGADLLFSELIDAVRYSQNWERTVKERDEARTKAKKQMEELDILSARISKSFDGLMLDPDTSSGLSAKVGEFVGLAIQQVKDRIKAKLKSTVEESESDAKSDELKAKRSLESYLAATPLPVIDEEISLELSDGSYAAGARYVCPGDIEYEFMLNTAASPQFRSEFTFAAIRKGVRIPVRLGRTWLKKEPVPDYEKMDGYSLAKAKASKNHLEATFVSHDTGANVELVFSRSGTEGFVTVEYSAGSDKVEVTAEAGLSKYLDLPTMKVAAGKLLNAINDLSKSKLQLSRLECAGEDVLATLDCLGFMERAVVVLVQSKDYLEALKRVNPKLAIERLKLLGPAGSKIMEDLGLAARGRK